MQNNLEEHVVFTLKEIRDEIFEWIKSKNPSSKLSHFSSLAKFLNNPYKMKFAPNKETDIPIGQFDEYLKSIKPFLKEKFENESYSAVNVFLIHLKSKVDKETDDEKLKQKIKAYAMIKNKIKSAMKKIVGPSHFSFEEIIGKTKKELREALNEALKVGHKSLLLKLSEKEFDKVYKDYN